MLDAFNGNSGRLAEGGRIWVTSTNHAEASKMSGLPLEEIKRRYEAAHANKEICTIIVGEKG